MLFVYFLCILLRSFFDTYLYYLIITYQKKVLEIREENKFNIQ